MKMLMFGMLGWPEIVAILVIVLILFGAKKVPELMRGIGEGIKEFKKASRDVQEELQRSIEEEPPPSPPPRSTPPKNSEQNSSKVAGTSDNSVESNKS